MLTRTTAGADLGPAAAEGVLLLLTHHQSPAREHAPARRHSRQGTQPLLQLQQGCYTDARQGKEDAESHAGAELLYQSTVFPVYKGGRALGPWRCWIYLSQSSQRVGDRKVAQPENMPLLDAIRDKVRRFLVRGCICCVLWCAGVPCS